MRPAFVYGGKLIALLGQKTLSLSRSRCCLRNDATFCLRTKSADVSTRFLPPIKFDSNFSRCKKARGPSSRISALLAIRSRLVCVLIVVAGLRDRLQRAREMEHRFSLSWKGIDGNGRTKESSVNLRGRKQELGRVGRSFRCRVRTYETRTHLRSTAYGINPENSNFRRGELFRHDAYSRVVGRVDETLLTSSFLYADVSRRFPRLRGRATCDYATQSGKLFTDAMSRRCDRESPF